MFQLTRNLTIFAALAIVLTVSFHWTLSWLIGNALWGWIIPLAICYTGLMFVNGWVNGSRDEVFKTRGDLGFSHHAMSFMVSIPIWMLFAWNRMEVSTSSKIGETVGVVIWGILLLVHMYFSRRSIKGYGRTEVFD